eukprot:SAG22_NODE_135_length_18211_cov_560.916519_8_plen_167_part_00
MSAIHHQRQDARRLKDLLDKRTQRTKELQKEVDDAKAAGGGSSERLKEAEGKVRQPTHATQLARPSPPTAPSFRVCFSAVPRGSTPRPGLVLSLSSDGGALLPCLLPSQVRDLTGRLNELKRLRNAAKSKADSLQVTIHEQEAQVNELEAAKRRLTAELKRTKVRQ